MSEFNLYLPITKVDLDRRIVEGLATSESLDKQNEIVDYAASKDAFDNWCGAIREMHEPKAVGKAVEIIKDDEKKQVYVKAYISKGAEDTWQKVKEGVLKGFSIGGQTVNKTVQIIKDATSPARQVTRITKYRLNELSLVDNPANPEAQFSLVKRAPDGVLYQTEVMEDGNKTVISEADEVYKAEVSGLQDRLEKLQKSVLTDTAVETLPDEQFAVVRKYASPQGTIVKERLIPIPDSAHAEVVSRHRELYELSTEEQVIAHERIVKAMGDTHTKCSFCETETRKSDGGDTASMDNPTVKEVCSKMDELIATIGKMLNPGPAGKETPVQDDKAANPVEPTITPVPDAATKGTTQEATPVPVEKAEAAPVDDAAKPVEDEAKPVEDSKKDEPVVEVKKSEEVLAHAPEKVAVADEMKKMAETVSELRKSVEELKKMPLPRKYAVSRAFVTPGTEALDKGSDTVEKHDAELKKAYDEVMAAVQDSLHSGKTLSPEMERKRKDVAKRMWDAKYPTQDTQKVQ